MRNLATHTAGFPKTGGFGALEFGPDSAWLYSDGDTNWLADLLTVSYVKDLHAVLRSRVLEPMGISYDQLVWRRNAYRAKTLRGIERREFGSGISTSVDVMARLGLMLLRDGKWKTTQILPATYADLAGAHQQWLNAIDCSDPERCPDATKHYGLLFWNNANGAMANVPKDAYWSHGLGDSFILVIPSLDIVCARAGSAWGSANQYQLLQPFFARVAQAVN